mmetsp:Transcript_21712/g.34002  ORF Transcript_21712/g.34002 Transcript_21712/m.34002 type:complete len:234 (+) Transcript_21712:75-776(+)
MALNGDTLATTGKRPLALGEEDFVELGELSLDPAGGASSSLDPLDTEVPKFSFELPDLTIQTELRRSGLGVLRLAGFESFSDHSGLPALRPSGLVCSMRAALVARVNDDLLRTNEPSFFRVALPCKTSSVSSRETFLLVLPLKLSRDIFRPSLQPILSVDALRLPALCSPAEAIRLKTSNECNADFFLLPSKAAAETRRIFSLMFLNKDFDRFCFKGLRGTSGLKLLATFTSS